ncbi:MAG: 23S rRNA (uridine(2552)-2'-O)-methyltransferase RlmE [Sulfuricaulis sp.]
MPRSKSSQRWLARNAKDEYVKRARQEGARSRAAYKLEEIDRRDRLLHPDMTVVDLGAAPGGWSQYVKSRVGAAGRVLALDILPMEPIPGVEFLEGDFMQQPVLDSLMERLQGQPVDLVISDMAPNMTGVPAVDQARSMELAELALEFADQTLKPGGAVLMKIFQGRGFNEFYAQMRLQFEKIVTRKPQASRSESREIYLLGKGFKAR